MATSNSQHVGGLSSLTSFSVFSWETILLSITLICAYLIARSVYFLTLHPLASVPGPKLCSITRAPYWLASIQGRDVRWMHELHLKYGSVVRFGPTDLSYTDAKAWKDIHGYSRDKVENVKAHEFSVQPVNGEDVSAAKLCTLRKSNPFPTRCAEYVECHLQQSLASPPTLLARLLRRCTQEARALIQIIVSHTHSRTIKTHV